MLCNSQIINHIFRKEIILLRNKNIEILKCPCQRVEYLALRQEGTPASHVTLDRSVAPNVTGSKWCVARPT
jgi:predicted secreted protein